MAAGGSDGSLKFDTKINVEGFEEGLSTLSKAMDRLTQTIKSLSSNILNAFGGAGQAVTETAQKVEETTQKAEETADAVDTIGEAAEKSAAEVKSLQEQMDAITITFAEEPENKESEPEPRKVVPIRPEDEALYGYNQEAIKFVEEYGQAAGKAEKEVNEFKAEIGALSAKMKELESQGMYFGDEEYDETYIKLAKVKQALADYKKEMLSPTPDVVSFPADSIQGQVERLKKSLNELEAQGKTFGDNLYDSTYQALNKAQSQLNEYKKNLTSPNELAIVLDEDTLQGKINSLKRQLEELGLLGKTFGDETYDSTYAALSKAQSDFAAYKKGLSQPVEILVHFDENSFEGRKQKLKAKLAELENQGITLGNPEYDSTYAALQRVTQAEQAYKKSLLDTDQAQKKATKSADGMKGKLKNTHKEAIPLTKSILKLSNMFKLMVLRMAAVIESVKEGFQNLAQYSGGVNTTLSSLMSSMLYLKNSFATAFAPILDVVVPALNAMIDAIANALSWIGQFLAALTGKGSFVKAKKTQEDYAKSLKKTGGAAKQAGKDAERSTASFDKLNLISEKGSGGGGGGGSEGTDPSQMFETVDVDSKITSMVVGMKQALSDFYSWMSKTFGPNLAKVWADMQPNIEKFKSTLLGMWTDLESLGEPLKNWFNADFVPFLQQTIDTMGFIVNGLFDSYNTVFSDIWNIVVFPMLQKFVTVGLPMMTQFATEVMATLEPLFTLVKDLFDRIWRDAIAPALELIMEIWTGCVDTLYEVWQEYGHPIFEAIRTAISSTGEVLNDIWDRYVKPVFDTFMDVADRLWTNHIQPLLKHFLEFGSKLILVALDIYNGVILPLVSWFGDILGPQISGEIQVVTEVFGVFGAFISGIVDSILLVLNGVLDFIHTGFTQGWDKAWSNVGGIFKDVFNNIIQIAENAVNFVIDSLNAISFDVPDWVPLAGGEHFGFNLDPISLPRLATGTVVPPRAGEFAAILGDNNREAEVVSPISAMKQAFREVVEDMKGGGGDIFLTVNLEGKAVYEEVIKQNRLRKRQTGKNPLLV